MKLIAEIILPLRLQSEANKADHWVKKHKRCQDQKHAVNLIFSGQVKTTVVDSGFPIIIKLIRVAPREFDKEDNLPMSFKHIKDFIANILIPGKQMGRADSDPNLIWMYEQEKGAVREYAAKIQFYKYT